MHPPTIDRATEIRKAVSALFVFLNTKDVSGEKTDVIFLVSSSYEAPARKAAVLYGLKRARKIVLISFDPKYAPGLVNGMSNNTEYMRVLTKYGVSKSDILTGDLTPNNTVRVEEVMTFLDGRGMIPKKVTLISRAFNQRRALAIFSKHCPGVQFFNQPASEPMNLDAPETHTRLIREVDMLTEHIIHGHVGEIALPPEVIQAADNLRRLTFTGRNGG